MVALKKKTSITLPVLLCVMLALAALNPPGKAQAPGAARKMMQPGGPKVLDDGRVTFTLNAPEADKVALNIHPGYRGHVWDVWRKNLRDFAPLLFR